MSNKQETPEAQRERLRQEELKNNPSGTFRDGLNRADHMNVADAAGGLGWKGTGISLAVLMGGYVLYKLFF